MTPYGAVDPADARVVPADVDSAIPDVVAPAISSDNDTMIPGAEPR